MSERPNEEPTITAEEMKTKLFLVTAKADNRKKSNPQVLYQYTEMLIPAPDLRCACDIAEEQFKEFDMVEVTKAQQVENDGKQRTKGS